MGVVISGVTAISLSSLFWSTVAVSLFYVGIKIKEIKATHPHMAWFLTKLLSHIQSRSRAIQPTEKLSSAAPITFPPLFFTQGELTSCFPFSFLLKWALFFLGGSSFSSLFLYLLLPFSVTQHKLYLYALLYQWTSL